MGGGESHTHAHAERKVFGPQGTDLHVVWISEAHWVLLETVPREFGHSRCTGTSWTAWSLNWALLSALVLLWLPGVAVLWVSPLMLGALAVEAPRLWRLRRFSLGG